jgi:hypothetical protein
VIAKQKTDVMTSIKTTNKIRQRASTVETTSRDLENSIMFSSNMPTPKPKIINTLEYIEKNEGDPDFDPKTGKTSRKRKSSGGNSSKRNTKEAWGSSPDKLDNSIADSP